MSTPPAPWASYRCPVCSHVDGVPVGREEPLHFECSHCGAKLEGDPSEDTGEHLPVRVRDERS